jgi:hypothetical protein
MADAHRHEPTWRRWCRRRGRTWLAYHGVLAPASALRAATVPAGAAGRRRRRCEPFAAASPAGRAGRHPWADLLRRVFGLEVLRWPGCGGRRRIVAAITQGSVMRAILESLGLPAEPPVVATARGPPELSWGAAAE